MKKKIKKKRRTAKQSQKEFTQKTRVYDLLKAGSHNELKLLVDDISQYVRDGTIFDWKHLRYFDFDEDKLPKIAFIFIVARFLYRINKGNGLKCKMSVFIRYLASNEHSNFGLKSSTLNTLIYRMLSYIDNNENNTEKL